MEIINRRTTIVIQNLNTNLTIHTIKPELTSHAMQLRLVGELSGDGAFLLKRAVEPLFASPKPPMLKLFMKDITYMDSSGVGIIISIIRRIRETGGKIEIHDLSDVGRELLNILKIANLDDIVSLACHQQ